MPAGHAPEGVVGVGGPAPARHGGGGKAVQGVVGVADRVVPGRGVRSVVVVEDGRRASVGVPPFGGGQAVLVRNGPEGVPRALVEGPVSVGGADRVVRVVTGRYDPRGPEQGIGRVGQAGDAAAGRGFRQGAVAAGRRQVHGTEPRFGPARAVVGRAGCDVVGTRVCIRRMRICDSPGTESAAFAKACCTERDFVGPPMIPGRTCQYRQPGLWGGAGTTGSCKMF